jgi:hypothetical protein
VDNSAQALYGSAKSLIYKGNVCVAQKTGIARRAAIRYSALRNLFDLLHI